jgi:hypothetical protein
MAEVDMRGRAQRAQEPAPFLGVGGGPLSREPRQPGFLRLLSNWLKAFSESSQEAEKNGKDSGVDEELIDSRLPSFLFKSGQPMHRELITEVSYLAVRCRASARRRVGG